MTGREKVQDHLNDKNQKIAAVYSMGVIDGLIISQEMEREQISRILEYSQNKGA